MLGSRRVFAQLDVVNDPSKQREILGRYFSHLIRHYQKGIISRHEVCAVVASFSQSASLRLSGPSDPYAEIIYLAMQLGLQPNYRRTDISWDEFEEKIQLLPSAAVTQ